MSEKTLTIDVSELTPRETNTQIRKAIDHDKIDTINLKNPNAMHYLINGIVGEGNIIVDGSAGYFAASMIDKPHVKINGNAGWFVGDNMTNGEIIVEGSAGDGAGQGIYGGTVVIRKSVGSRTGEIMKNGTVIVGGDSGFMSGIFMMGGRIIILGNVGEDAAESIVNGVMYVRGKVESLGKNAYQMKVNEEDKKELKELLTKYEFDIPDEDYDKFKKIIPHSKRPFFHKKD
jgi:glutamate synthase domain-containing protein 3